MIIIPGNVPEYLEKCRRLEADALIIDIQDAIAKVDGQNCRQERWSSMR